MKEDTKRKVIIYGGNLAGGIIGNAIKVKMGNPAGAIIYGVLDVASQFSQKIKSSKYTRLAKAVGGVFYGVNSFFDVLGVVSGDAANLIQLPFDVSMTYQLGKDAIDSYKGKDLTTDIKHVIDDGKGLVGKLK